MGGYYGLFVLVGMALLLTTGQCDVSCQGIAGRPGEKGTPGRDGWPGQKGEKGEPVVMRDGPMDAGALIRLRGEKGSQGLQGAMGPKGYRGDLGATGMPGNPGRPGLDGESIGQGHDSPHQAHSAFSAMRTLHSYPSLEKAVTYDVTVVNKPQADFNKVTGQFTCRVPGVYYFTFHAVAKVSICLRIASDALIQKVGFCDYNVASRNAEQVLSGGLVLELTVRQKVWLESFRERQTNSDVQDSREKKIIFSGFLLFANSA